MKGLWKKMSRVFSFKSDDDVSDEIIINSEKDTKKEIIYPDIYEEESVIKNRRILEWQDYWLQKLVEHWVEERKFILKNVIQRMKSRKKSLFTSREKYFRNEIFPLIDELVTIKRNRLIEEMQIDLNRRGIAAFLPASIQQAMPSHLDDQGIALTDVGMAATPLVAGAAAVPLALHGGITTTAGIFGLFAATTVAWPVIAGGAAAAAVLGATGVIKTKGIFEKSKGRFRDGIDDFLVKALLFNAQNNAVAQQMQGTVLRIAQSMLKNPSDKEVL